MIHDLALARAIHVLGLIHWIGGMAVVTTIVLPRARALPDAGQAIEVFEAFERRFSSQVRISILLVGLSGGYMVTKLDAWDLFQRVSFCWLHLMVAVWLLFALVVFVLEPTFLHRSFHAFVVRERGRAFAMAIRFHVVALTIAVVAIVSGILGAAGALQ